MFVATSKQMKAYDEALLEDGYTIEELVDKASNVLLLHCNKYNNTLIVCGPGNNGADGISLAIKLHKQHKKVKLYIISDFEKLSSANQFYLGVAKQLAVPTTFLEEETIEQFIEDAILANCVVDAMFGVGLNKDVHGITKSVIEEINKLYDTEIISIDIPTGLNPDTGIPYQSVVLATKTISLTALKQAFFNEECHMYTGEIIVELLDTRDLREEVGLAKLVSPSWIKYHLKPRIYHGHKGNYGKVLHITGSTKYPGAALLSSRASVYSGSGIVCVYSNQTTLNALNVLTPECTVNLREDELDLEVMENKDAILIGCGLGLDEKAHSLVFDVIENTTLPLVIDADALTILSKDKEVLKDCRAPIVLTPHFGEFKRLVSYDDELDMIEVAKEFAKEYRVVLALKGPNTIITDGEETYRNITANKAMATAGTGDVLAGMIVSFIGQGYSVKNAAIIATYLHGQCGDIIATKDYTVLPSKLIELIPEQMHRIVEE